LLFDVPFEKTGRRRSRLAASGKACPLRGDIKTGEDLLDPPVDEIPTAHILRLFLAPDYLGIAVSLQNLRKRIGRKRINLLDAHQRNTFITVIRPRFRQIEVDLARAQYDATNILIRRDHLAFADHAMKQSPGLYVVEARGDLLGAQQRLR